jgi:mRNA interferase MazF
MQSLKRGEVWWVTFGSSVGGEIRKTRPAVVVSNNAANEVLNRVVVVPLTSRTSKVYPSEVLVQVEGREVKAVANQIATAAKERLQNRMGSLSPADLRAVEDAILLHLGIRR